MGSEVVARGSSCTSACGVFLDPGSNLCPLHGQMEFYPLLHQASLAGGPLTSAPLGKPLSSFFEMIHVVRAPRGFLVWTWPSFLCLELYACTHTCTHAHTHTYMYTHTYTHANRRALYVVSGGEAVRPCTGGTGKSRREGPEVEPGLASWGAWPAARQLENRLDSGGTTCPMDPDLETVQMWWGCGRHSGCPLGDGCPLKVETLTPSG